MLGPDELRKLGHQPMTPMQALRAHCLDCCAGSAHEVALCAATRCPSWPFRLGRNPWRPPLSAERREVLAERGRQLAAAKKNQSLGDEVGGAGSRGPAPEMSMEG